MSSGNRGILKVFRRAARKAKNFRLFTKRSSFEGFFASKGAAYALPDGDFARRATKHGGEMQLHLQAMVNLLRDEDVLRLVIRLESQYPNRIRYLTIVSAFGPDEEEQSIVMGVDWIDKATIGLVVPLYRDTTIKLDGDGGFKMTSADKTNIFKPISVQTMWTALQWIHKCNDIARKNNYFYPNGPSHAWVQYYYRKTTSDRICLNEWHQMEDILIAKRPESPVGTSPEKELIMKLIRHKVREIMTKVDLEEVTCRQVRTMLEEDTQMELKEYRSFIDEEMITILGQMDSASHIFDHVYLGSDWNASNLEELKENRVGYILNITREVDNFFPGTFYYYNIRVYDLEETELLHHWENTYKFIQKAKNAGSNVLVHCRMGISRSASTVIAYGMKEYGWSLGDTMKHVKARRSIIQPNQGFWKQLVTYEGILNSSKQRYNKLFTNRPEPGDLENTGEGKKLGNNSNLTTEQLIRAEGKENVYEFPIETTAEKTGEGISTHSGGSQMLTENNLKAFDSTTPLLEDIEGDSTEAMASSLANPNLKSNLFIGETESSSETEKTLLHRVRSVPSLSREEANDQESNSGTTGGNFKRSNSMRERGTKSEEQLRPVMERKSASDENVTEFGWGKKGVNESDAHKDLQQQLHSGLERGFVKRESKKFEAGVYSTCATAVPLTEDRPEREAVKDDNVCEGTLSESSLGEEPEPGLVKKHKEEYELKHNESLKRGALLQRTNSGERSSLKREKREMLADSVSSKAEETPEGEQIRQPNIDVLMQKVNEDMQKEVSIAQMSKKGLELGEKQAGQLVHLESLGRVSTEVRSGGATWYEKLTNDLLLRDLQSTQVSVECSETSMAEKGNEDSVNETDGQRQERVQQDDVSRSKEQRETSNKHDYESISQRGLVKRHTLLIEERLQPIDQMSQKQDGGKGETESGQKIDFEENFGPVTIIGEARDSTTKFLVEEDKNSLLEVTVRDGDTDTDELPKPARDSEEKDIPQKGLVKRHTLLIEGKLNPLEQLNDPGDEGNNDNEAGQESHLEIVLDMTAETKASEKESITAEGNHGQELSQDRQDKGSEEDYESMLHKGLVKRHTLMIEGKLQPQPTQEIADGTKDEHLVHETIIQSHLETESRGTIVDSEQKQLNIGQLDTCDQVKRTLQNEHTGGTEESEREAICELDTDLPAQKGLVKRHTLLIEGKQPSSDQAAKEEEDSQVKEGAVKQGICGSVNQQSYLIERESKFKSEDGEGNGNELSASGLVKREKMRIEERVNPTASEVLLTRQEVEMETDNCDTGTKSASGDCETCGDEKENNDDDSTEGLVEEKEKEEVGVDTSSVVRVKDHTQHLEGIIRVTTTPKDTEKRNEQTFEENFHDSNTESAKNACVPRSCSDDQIAQRTEASSSEGLLEDVLSESAVNIALIKAQESLDLEHESFVDWDVANVKQRTRVFEEIVRHFNNDNNDEDQIRRFQSIARTVHPSDKHPLRRRSFSDVTEIVSSSSGREIGYTIQFSNGESSTSSSLPSDWKPLRQRQQSEGCKERKTTGASSPEMYKEGEQIHKNTVELIHFGNVEQNDAFNVKERIQVLDSKNGRNISSVR